MSNFFFDSSFGREVFTNQLKLLYDYYSKLFIIMGHLSYYDFISRK